MRLNRVLWLLFGLLCAACDSSKPRIDFSPFHGIYKVNAHTRNQKDCAAEGGAVADGRDFMVLYTLSFPGLAMATSCGDVTSCRERSVSDGPIPLGLDDFAAEFERSTTDPQGLTGIDYGDSSDGTAYVTDNLLTKTGDQVRLEMRRHVLACVARGNDDCDYQATVAAAATAPCSELRVVEATFAQGL